MTGKKTPRLGNDPLGWMQDTREETKASKPVKQHTVKTAKQLTVKPAHAETDTPQPVSKVKATYYLSPDLLKKLKFVGVDQDRDLSDLVAEAIGDLVKKYGSAGK